MYRCYLRGGRICQASPPTCPSWTGRVDDNNKLIIIIVSILYRCTIYGPLGIFKSPVAPFVLLFRLPTECPFLLPQASVAVGAQPPASEALVYNMQVHTSYPSSPPEPNSCNVLYDPVTQHYSTLQYCGRMQNSCNIVYDPVAQDYSTVEC